MGAGPNYTEAAYCEQLTAYCEALGQQSLSGNTVDEILLAKAEPTCDDFDLSRSHDVDPTEIDTCGLVHGAWTQDHQASLEAKEMFIDKV